MIYSQKNGGITLKKILSTLCLFLLTSISVANPFSEGFIADHAYRYEWIKINNKNAVITTILFLIAFIITIATVVRYNKKLEKEDFNIDKRKEIENKLVVLLWIPIIVFIICELVFEV